MCQICRQEYIPDIDKYGQLIQCNQITHLYGVNLSNRQGIRFRLPNLIYIDHSCLTNIDYVEFINYKKLSKMPNLNGIKKMYLINCPQLTKIENNSDIKQLIIRNCDQLVTLPPNLYGLQHLELTRCPLIKNIPNYPNVKELICQELKINNLPLIPELECLELKYCHQLNNLPILPSLQRMGIINCQGKIVLPPYPSLVELEISFNSLITQVKQPVLEYFDSVRSQINTIECPKLKFLKLRACPQYQYQRKHIPEILNIDVKSSLF